MKLLRISAVLLALSGFAAAANAQANASPRGNISGFGSFGVSASSGVEKGHGGGGSAAFFFSDALGVEGAFALRNFDIAAPSGSELTGGELKSTTFSVNVVGRFAAGSLQPFVSGGVTFLQNDYSIDSSTAAQLSQFNFSSNEAVDNTIGFNVGGGIEFPFSDRLGAFIEGRYTIAKADSTGGLTDVVSDISATTNGELELNFLTINGGIRIFF